MIEFHRVQTLKKWRQRILIPLVVLSLRLYWLTLRVKLSDAAKNVMAETSGPTVFLLWHNNLPVAPILCRMLEKSPTVHGLISPSSDGAWLAEIFCSVGIKSIRGSSKRNGVSAISAMVEKLNEGASVAITPDGPRGPVYKFKNGAAMVVKSSGVDVTMFALKYGR
ncbi:MAG: DUF374 domain-containing protein, partial [Puniceicoccales bacterium]|nr:DUF374 domain-containing protein [Puniceicoccales bacterium]